MKTRFEFGGKGTRGGVECYLFSEVDLNGKYLGPKIVPVDDFWKKPELCRTDLTSRENVG